MKLLKRDIGEMALAVLTTGETSSANVSGLLPGSMEGYTGPERSRSDFRRKQTSVSKRGTLDILDVLRTEII